MRALREVCESSYPILSMLTLQPDMCHTQYWCATQPATVCARIRGSPAWRVAASSMPRSYLCNANQCDSIVLIRKSPGLEVGRNFGVQSYVHWCLRRLGAWVLGCNCVAGLVLDVHPIVAPTSPLAPLQGFTLSRRAAQR